MRIVADKDLYRVDDLFASLGELELIPGRDISRSHLQNADVLLVRSVTRVSKELLENTSVRFVGTATSGIDHIDEEYLLEQGVKFAHAKGSNANAVVDYCFAALAELDLLEKQKLGDITVGIVGCGEVGSRFARKLSNLGVAVKVCDPPLEKTVSGNRNSAPKYFSSLEGIAQCDVISLHTPLIKQGAHPTAGMIDAKFLAALNSGAVLFNTCRGGVVNEKDVLAYSREKEDFTYVADVWENEPSLSSEIVNAARIATPHIAGYSRESKYAAVNMLRDSLGDFVGAEKTQAVMSASQDKTDNYAIENFESLQAILSQKLSLRQIDKDLKAAVNSDSVLNYFDAARKQLVSRREYGSLVLGKTRLEEFDRNVLTELGVTWV
jgi:erythronate-4-phosphate dehydrogenase